MRAAAVFLLPAIFVDPSGLLLGSFSVGRFLPFITDVVTIICFMAFAWTRRLDCSVDHRVDALIHRKFILNGLRRKKQCVSTNEYISGVRRRRQNRRDFFLDRATPFQSGLEILPWALSPQIIGKMSGKYIG